MDDKKYFLEMSLGNLAWVNEEIGSTKEMIKHLNDQLEKLPIYQKMQDLKDRVKSLEGQAGLIREEIRPEAIALYNETGEKNLVDGLSIKVYQLVEYYEDEALDFCVENDLRAALTLNKKVWEKYCKGMEGVAPPPFVTFRDDPRTAISSDLSGYLGVGING